MYQLIIIHGPNLDPDSKNYKNMLWKNLNTNRILTAIIELLFIFFRFDDGRIVTFSKRVLTYLLEIHAEIFTN